MEKKTISMPAPLPPPPPPLPPSWRDVPEVPVEPLQACGVNGCRAQLVLQEGKPFCHHCGYRT